MLATTGRGQITTTNFFNWETAPIHPVALSPDGARLAVCNLPDARVEIFDITSGKPVPAGNLPVGIDPVTGLADLLRVTETANLPRKIEKNLVARVRNAQKAFARGKPDAAFDQLTAFRNKVINQHGDKIPTVTADALLAVLDRIVGCIDD